MLALVALTLAADPTAALKPFGPLVGSWKCTGTPEGSREDRQKGFWTETIQWQWAFTAQQPSLTWTSTGGKHFSKGELRPTDKESVFTLTVTKPDKSTETYTGPLTAGKQKEQILTLDRDAGGETHRLVLTLLHGNRYLLRSETKPAAASSFARRYQIGATKEGEPFASANTGPECVVTGGKGTISVSHKGKTYYVCCSGCKDAFLEAPEKYITAKK